MTKHEFLSLMHFPDAWMTLGMYPDELFTGQLSSYQPGHENASEHDRNGAFHWWLRRDPTHQTLENLLRLAALDPDHHLANDLRRYIAQAKAYDEHLHALDKTLFAK